MREKPIIFNTKMVRAILEGRKNQTRRVIDNKIATRIETFDDNKDLYIHHKECPNYCDYACGGVWQTDLENDTVMGSPYGQPGDRLWVRETWSYGCDDFETNRKKVHYKADGKDHKGHKWKASIHMFKKYTRLWLEVIDVRVERLQDITVDGCDGEMFGGDFPSVVMPEFFNDDFSKYSIEECFALYWDSINEKRGYGWETNPWVWVVKFKLLEGK